MPILASLVIAALVILGLTKSRGVFGPVERKRIERFAARQQLAITVANGNRVIAYLATTRRWRAGGLAVSIAASFVWGIAHGGPSFGSLQLFSAWFAGAVIAEWRVTKLPAGDRRAASLEARAPELYVSRVARAAPPLFAAVSVAALVVCVAVPGARQRLPMGELAFNALVATVFAAIGRLVERRILDRPQPLTAPDLVAADDAIRSRSLHVTVASITAVTGFCLGSQLSAVAHTYPGTGIGSYLGMVAVLGPLCVAIAAYRFSTLPWSVRRTVAGHVEHGT